MKFFRPELLKRYRSDDEAVADAAFDEWEAMVKKYRRQLNALQKRMPENAQVVLRAPSLHDGTLIGYLIREKLPWIDLIVRLDSRVGSHGRVLVFQYETATHSLKTSFSEETHDIGAKGDPKKHIPRILYDEFDEEPRGAFSHSVLQSNGLVTKVRFRDLVLVRGKTLLEGGRERDSLRLASA